MSERYVKLQKEENWDDGGDDNLDSQYLKVADVDMQTEQEFDEIEEANRETLEESYIVQRTGGGSFSMWGRADELGLILYALFGKCEIVDIGTQGEEPYQLNFEPDMQEIFSLAMTEGKDKMAYKYSGQMIQSITITAEIGEVMTVEVDTFGNGAVTEAKEDPNYVSPQENPIFTLKNAEIKLGNDERTDLQSITITIENNISEDEHTLGSLDIQEMPPGQRRNVEIDLEFRSEDDKIFDDFINGTTAELITEFQTDQEIESGYPYGFKLIFPRIQYREVDQGISGRDPIRASVPARALYDQDVEYDQGDGQTKTANAEVIATLTGTKTGTLTDSV